MKTRTLVLSAVAAASLGSAGYGVYLLGLNRGMAVPPAPAAPAAKAEPADEPMDLMAGQAATVRHMKDGLKAGDVDPVNGRRISHYHDPMAPGKNFDAPGKSPLMDMMLVPVYAGADADRGQVTVSPRVQQNLGIRTAAVESGTLAPAVAAVGTIAYNERDQVLVQARATGYIQRLFVRATLDPVQKGQPLAEMYVPDWVAAQEEFLAVRRMQGTELAGLVDGARQRMRQVGMSDAQIARVEAGGKVEPRITLEAPIGGVVAELAAREGMTVMTGAMLFRINGLGTVWANAEVPEGQAALVRPGAAVEARSPAVPGTLFKGRVQAIVPEVNPATRTLKARVELANAGGRLVPGMFVTMSFAAPAAAATLLVPSEAVIQTGKRSVVMVAEADGRFRPAEVETGAESNGKTEIRRGLAAGMRVVVSGQFLIDSEASLAATETRMNETTPAPAAGGSPK